MTPTLDAVVQRARQQSVTATICDGEVIYKNGKFTRVDRTAARALGEAAAVRAQIRKELHESFEAPAVLPAKIDDPGRVIRCEICRKFVQICNRIGLLGCRQHANTGCRVSRLGEIGVMQSFGGPEMKKLWVGAAALLLGGCSAIQVATFKSDDDSFKRKGEKLSIAVAGMPTSSTGPAGSSKDWLRIREPEGTRLRDVCGIPAETTSGTAAPTFLPGLAVLAAGILIDAGIAKLNEYADRKIKEFKHTYSARLSVGRFYLPRNNGSDRVTPRTRCILFQREVDVGTNSATPNVRAALTLVLQFQALGDRAYVLTPIYLDLAYAGARTSAEGNSVDLDIAVGIAVVKPGAGTTLVSELATQQNYSVRKVALRGNNAERPSYAAKFEPGTIIPAFDGVTAATVVVAVTETGDGSEEFGQLRKDSDAYGKVLKDLGIDQLKSLLGVK